MKEFIMILGWSMGMASSVGIAIISIKMIKEIINMVKATYQEIDEAKEMYFNA